MFGLDEIVKDFKLPQSILSLTRIYNETCPLLETVNERKECQKKIKKLILIKVNELI